MQNYFPDHTELGDHRNVTLANYVGEISQMVIYELQKEFNTGTSDLEYATKVSRLLADSHAVIINAMLDFTKE